jgi:hypothetical protein
MRNRSGVVEWHEFLRFSYARNARISATLSDAKELIFLYTRFITGIEDLISG